jgi:hemoglobin-like flavoprotein
MPNTGHILRTSYDAIPSKSRLYDRFYALLFERHPEVRRLFPTDLKQQREHLAAAVSALVMNAEQFGALEPMLRELGERHVRYGAHEAHYPVVAGILLECLAEHMGDRWTPDVQQAWAAALTHVCDIMIRGARMAHVQPQP